METAPSHREMNYLEDQQLGDVEGPGINPDYAFEVPLISTGSVKVPYGIGR